VEEEKIRSGKSRIKVRIREEINVTKYGEEEETKEQKEKGKK
jgi:hypothetical protein